MVVFPRIAPLLTRLCDLIVNNNLTPTVNGEYWFITQFRDGGTYVDVGYHRGEWSAEVVRQKKSARVLAFDPWPDAGRYYEDSLTSSQVEFFASALSDQEGYRTFYDYQNACNSLAPRDLEVRESPKEYQVAVTTLDAWSEKMGINHIDLVKIDVEGYDLSVLKGARGLLESRAIEGFVFEYGSGWIASRQFLGEAAAYIMAAGYHLCKLFDGFVVPFQYRISHETFAGGMFVGLSPRLWEQQTVPVRELYV